MPGPDWKIGEDVVFVGGHKLGQGHPEAEALCNLRNGQLCKVEGYSRSIPECPEHGRSRFVWVEESPAVQYCPHCFRKPLPLRKMFNLHRYIRIKEDV